jgi:hypothetical protein
MLFVGNTATATDYEQYQGDTYSVTFSDQGTVYGGTFDFVTGDGEITMLSYDLAGRTWTMETIGDNTVFSCNAISTKALNYNFLCNKYKNAGTYRSNLQNGECGCFNNAGGRNRISICDNAYSTVADFVASIADIQVVYELATPQTFTLSPQQIETLLGENNVWSDAGEISKLVYRSNQYVMAYDWFETWTMPKITRNNGNVIVLPYPQEYTPDIYDVDASTTGRNAAGTMIRDRVAVKHKFNYKFPPLSQADATEILNAVRDSSFTLTTASPETGAKTNYRVYVGDRSLPVYWMPNHNQNSWLYETLTLNLIEM